VSDRGFLVYVLDLIFCIGDKVAVGLPKLSRLKDVSVNVSLLFTLVMVDVSKICEERFGSMQLTLLVTGKDE
jgi:hypothetical protein